VFAAFAEDVVRVQPDGPYLLGGHSYGGAVAVEIALVLESWGRHVALVMVRAEVADHDVMVTALLVCMPSTETCQRVNLRRPHSCAAGCVFVRHRQVKA